MWEWLWESSSFKFFIKIGYEDDNEKYGIIYPMNKKHLKFRLREQLTYL